ncbi:MAG: hypothetical protein M0D57_16905 [Sphingobacteriales bacterium JAD_PAG50586_3]|nr:MAG: hypothetical protein M0D57_16905 [Sphingobacteriales bacterium JAD_PAG50586_3]
MNKIWEEDQHLPPNFFRDGADKIIQIEIPDSTGIAQFHFENEDIQNNLHCYVFQRYFKYDDGFYRVDKGFVSGEKINGVWDIDFNVEYGGKHHDKYHMIKGANY